MHRLTPREIEVAALVSQGKQNKEIAWELQVREGTVKEHLRTIFRKLRISNRVQLTLLYLDDQQQHPIAA